MNQHSAPLRVLVAPLNWGLGHTSRCIPLIKTFEQMGVSVVLASDGEALKLLKAEFPHLPAYKLPSYRIKYATGNMILNIAKLLPRILFAIRTEQWEVERLVKAEKIDAIVSDNRYGCFSRHTTNVILTHQLKLKIPNRTLEWMVNLILRKALQRFHQVWVPDVQGTARLSGDLSDASQFEKKLDVCYIGILSRMERFLQEQEYQVAVVLSGPEPQRSILEHLLLEQAMTLPHKFIFVQGKMKANEHQYLSERVEVVSYFTSSDLNQVLLASDVVVCRSGYSSIMDLAVLGKKALLVPTPGQTEQEYLAHRMQAENIFLVQTQDQINLETALNNMHSISGLDPAQFHPEQHIGVLASWVDSLKNRVR